MPWTKQQQHVAQAVEHGWQPKGSAKGFTRTFAAQVIEESGKMLAKHKGKRLRDYVGGK